MAYFLMENRTVPAYKAAINAWMDTFGAIRPVSVMADYEDALRLAAVELWPAVQVQGCWFHFAQAVLRKAVKTSVAKAGMEDVVQMAMTLPLLPQSEMGEGFALIRRLLVVEGGTKFCNYLESQWGNKNISVFRLDHRTNNLAESFHRNLMRLIEMRKPGMWCFVRNLQQVNHMKAMDLKRLIAKSQMKISKAAMKERRIANAQARFQQDKNVEQLLRSLRSLMGDVYRRSVKTVNTGTESESILYTEVEYLHSDNDEETESVPR